MKKIIFLLVIILSVYACKKDKSSDNSSGLTGEWAWISTCGLSGNYCQTPATTHTSQNLVFTSDSLFYDYQNDTLKLSGIFHTNKSGSLYGIIKYDSDPGDEASFSLFNDTLTLVNLYGFIVWVSRYKTAGI